MHRPGRSRSNSRHQHNHNNSISMNSNTTMNSSYQDMAPPPQRADFPMSPSSRYSRNLKILHRHDSTIHTIIDQFPLVTLYELQPNEEEWDNGGCEGPMFIFERSEPPNYGFCIMNRIGLEDHLQYFDATDNVEDNEKLFFYRSGKSPRTNPVKALWTHQEEGDGNPKERLAQTMLMVNRCLKKGIPIDRSLLKSYPNIFSHSSSDSSQTPVHGAVDSQTDPLGNLFAKLSSLDDSASKGKSRAPNRNAVSTPPHSNLSGTALLSSIFASVGPQTAMSMGMNATNTFSTHPSNITNPTPPPPPPVSSESMHLVPHSPRPQVLTPSIIDAIMGLERVSPATASTESSSGGGLGLDLELDLRAKPETGSGVQSLGLTPVATPTPYSNPHNSRDGPPATSTPVRHQQGHERKRSDPKVNGGYLHPSPPQTPPNARSFNRPPSRPVSMSPSPAKSKSKGRPQRSKQNRLEESAGRNLVPFEDESELWPYPRRPVDDRTMSFAREQADRARARDRQAKAGDDLWDGPLVDGRPSPGPAVTGGGIKTTNTSREVRAPARAEQREEERYIPRNLPVMPGPPSLTPSPEADRSSLQALLTDAYLSSHTYGAENGVKKLPGTKHELIREVLSLIHTDNGFVEGLWEAYLAKVAQGTTGRL